MPSKNEIEDLIASHREAPHQRLLQKTLAQEVTVMVHSEEDYQAAVDASEILFGKATAQSLSSIREDMFLSVFEGVPLFEIDPATSHVSIMDLLSTVTSVFASRGELRRLVDGGGLMINKEKVTDPDRLVKPDDFINGKYLVVQKGKKNYYLITLKN
jgi:tyrosyl-tRNA synthetase